MHNITPHIGCIINQKNMIIIVFYAIKTISFCENK